MYNFAFGLYLQLPLCPTTYTKFAVQIVGICFLGKGEAINPSNETILLLRLQLLQAWVAKASFLPLMPKALGNLTTKFNAYPRTSTTIFYLIWILRFFMVFPLVYVVLWRML